MRRIVLILVAGTLLAACGGGDDDGEPPPDRGGTPTQLDSPPGRNAVETEGRQLVAQSGCLACHRVGSTGNDGPGPDLNDVGGRLSAADIGRILVDPRAPMPSFRDMPASERRAIAAYLSGLR